jgi:hypothetical protein
MSTNWSDWWPFVQIVLVFVGFFATLTIGIMINDARPSKKRARAVRRARILKYGPDGRDPRWPRA